MELLIKSTIFIHLLTGFVLVSTTIYAQQNLPTLAEQLGYPADSRLLIIHADDLGVAHSKNSAGISAWEKGGINSASIMVPTPWFPDIADYARKNSEFDLGIHLTLTAEWQFYKWNGVLPSNEISSLVNNHDYFYATVAEVVEYADPSEVEKEIRAQIDRAIDFGIKPTHLDSHMGTLFAHPKFFEAYLKAGQEYKIPVMVPLNWIENAMFSDNEENREIMRQADEYPVHVKQVIMLLPETPESEWVNAYDQAIRSLEPGLNVMLIHPAYDNAEMKAITINHHHFFDAVWRQRDYDYVVSRRFRNLLEKENIQLVTWREIQELMYPEM
jgi:chitin disaccharide deacetylase